MAVVVMLTGCREGRNEASEAPRVLVEQTADLREFLHAELAAGKKRIVIPPGRYRVDTERGQHLAFEDLENVEIIAYDVEMVCTSTIAAIRLSRCSSVTLRGLTIDYDPLPFTQGKIVSMTEGKSSMVFEVADGYPREDLEERIQIYDPATGELRRGDGQWKPEIEALGEGRYRAQKSDGYRFDPLRDTEQVGDILVTNHRAGGAGSPHAVVLRDCEMIHLEDVVLYASPCFGFLELDCEGSTYIRCIIDRRDPADDPVKRALPRMRSLNADAFHSKDAPKGPAIIACTARYQGDDCVAINGRYHYVSRSEGRKLRIAALDEPNFLPGDPVEFLPYSGPRPPDARVVELRPDPEPISAEEEAFIRKLRIDRKHKAQFLSKDARFFTLILDRVVELPVGSAVCCPLRVGSGFAVTDCDFGHNRSRGILIKSSNGRITNNRIINSRMAAVLIAPEYWWMEGGISSDVVVSDNFIKGCLETPIQVLARGGNGRPLPVGARRNISIIDNRIEDSAWPLIRVTSTENLTIEGNSLQGWSGDQDTAGTAAKAIELEFCNP